MKAAISLVSLLASACFTISAAQRLQPFSLGSRLWQAGFVLTGTLALFFPLYFLLRKAWQGRSGWRKHLNRLELAVALLLGLVLVGLFYWLPVYEGKAPHTLEIAVNSTPPAGPKVVSILEVRDDEGRVIRPADFRISGDWRIEGNGFFIQSDRPAKLSYALNGNGGEDVQVLIKKLPDGGQVEIVVDQTRKSIDLSSPVEDHQILTFTLAKVRRWSALVRVIDLLSAVGLLAASLFLSAFAVRAVPRVQFSAPRVARRHTNAVFIVLFLVLLGLPLVNLPANIREFDHKFWQREQLIQNWVNFRIQVLGDRVFSAVYARKDHWLTFIGEKSLDDYQNTLPVSDADLAVMRKNLDDMYEHCERRGITFLVVVTPNKNTIYPEYMPAEIPVLGKQSLLDRLIEAQRISGKAQILDLRPALLAAKRERQIYIPSDTHWNDYGAWIGYREIMRALQKDFPALQPHALEDYQEISKGGFLGDMGRLTGYVSFEEKTYRLKPAFQQKKYSWGATGFGADAVNVSFQPDSDLPRLVMYHDSFGVALMPFLSDHFRQITYLADYQVDKNFVDAEAPDIVILEVTERLLFKLIY